MNTAPLETNRNSRDGVSLVVFSFVTAGTWVAGCGGLYALFSLMNHGH